MFLIEAETVVKCGVMGVESEIQGEWQFEIAALGY